MAVRQPVAFTIVILLGVAGCANCRKETGRLAEQQHIPAAQPIPVMTESPFGVFTEGSIVQYSESYMEIDEEFITLGNLFYRVRNHSPYSAVAYKYTMQIYFDWSDAELGPVPLTWRTGDEKRNNQWPAFEIRILLCA